MNKYKTNKQAFIQKGEFTYDRKNISNDFRWEK